MTDAPCESPRRSVPSTAHPGRILELPETEYRVESEEGSLTVWAEAVERSGRNATSSACPIVDIREPVSIKTFHLAGEFGYADGR
jgi:hypothetical protein